MTDEDPGRVLTVLVVKKYYILDAKYTASKKLSPEVCGGVRVVSGQGARLGTPAERWSLEVREAERAL